MHILHTNILSEKCGDFNKLSTLCRCVPMKCKPLFVMSILWGLWGLFQVACRQQRCQAWPQLSRSIACPQPWLCRAVVVLAGGATAKHGAAVHLQEKLGKAKSLLLTLPCSTRRGNWLCLEGTCVPWGLPRGKAAGSSSGAGVLPPVLHVAMRGALHPPLLHTGWAAREPRGEPVCFVCPGTAGLRRGAAFWLLWGGALTHGLGPCACSCAMAGFARQHWLGFTKYRGHWAPSSQLFKFFSSEFFAWKSLLHSHNLGF